MPDLSFYIDIALILALIFFIYKKIFGWNNFKEHSKNDPIKIYKIPTTPSKIIKIVALILLCLYGAYFIYNTFINNADILLSNILILLFLIYIGILPNSTNYSVITSQGVFIYVYDTMIKWGDIITTGYTYKNDLCHVTVMVKKQKGEIFKRTHYRFTIPKEDKEDVENFIKSNLKRIEQLKLLKKSKTNPTY